MDISINATKGEGGSWAVSAHGTDIYDFAPQDYGSPVLDTAANIGYFGQQSEALSNFTTTVDFNHSVTLDKE